MCRSHRVQSRDRGGEIPPGRHQECHRGPVPRNPRVPALAVVREVIQPRQLRARGLHAPLLDLRRFSHPGDRRVPPQRRNQHRNDSSVRHDRDVLIVVEHGSHRVAPRVTRTLSGYFLHPLILRNLRNKLKKIDHYCYEKYCFSRQPNAKCSPVPERAAAQKERVERQRLHARKNGHGVQPDGDSRRRRLAALNGADQRKDPSPGGRIKAEGTSISRLQRRPERLPTQVGVRHPLCPSPA